MNYRLNIFVFLADLETQDCKSALPTQAHANAAGKNFAAAVGRGKGTDVVSCLQSLPASVIENTVQR